MTDIVERLRATPCNREPFTPAHAGCQCRVANEAAAEIERLRAALSDLVETYEWATLYDKPNDSDEIVEQAKKALRHD